MPAGEQTRYKKFIGTQKAEGSIRTPLPAAVQKAAGRILGKDLSKFMTVKLKDGDSDYILVGYQSTNDYSQFHFGAGEASVIEMVSKIEGAENESLVLIEEIENGLHPLAIERMVEYLLETALKKRVQVIFTTHSEYALKQLPPDAVWACIDGEAYPGRLSIESLRAITGTVEKERVIFVEDSFARDWVEDIVRQHVPSALGGTEIHVAGGFPRLLDVAMHHNRNPSILKKAAAVVDGDANTATSSEVFKLPGEIPENEVFGFLSQNVESLAGLIQQRCQCPSLSQDDIAKLVKQVELSASDPHLLFRDLGERLGYISEIIARKGFISIYNERNKDCLKELIASLQAFAFGIE